MRKRIARELRTLAARLDPPPKPSLYVAPNTAAAATTVALYIDGRRVG